MPLAVYLCILAASCLLALRDWRMGWLALLFCGALQDPVRKLTPNAPVVISFSVIAIYAVILFSARRSLIAHLQEFGRRFPNVHTAAVTFLIVLGLAAVNGLVTFGMGQWKVPMLSLFTYIAPLPAVILGYTWLEREELLYRFFRVYAALTSIALVGTLLEYLRYQSPVLGLVAAPGDYIRHLPGLQIRMLSGFYRAPDVMGWHASTLTAIAIAMAVRHGFGRKAWPWIAVATWGFFNCMISGRRKAIYYVAAFGLAFLWRYFRRMRISQLVALAAVALVLAGIIQRLASDERTNVYARGAATTQGELVQRLEGGMIGTFRQSGLLGSGLGTATQGTRHLVSSDRKLGWQEGGLAKFAAELGLPGIVTVLLLGIALMRTLLLLTRIGDVPGSSQFARVTLFALLVANAVTFMASAQAYTDATLALTTAFLIGCLFATAALDERLAATAPEPQRAPLPAPAVGVP